MNRIRNSVKDRQSCIAWQTVYEVSKRKGTSRSKLKDLVKKNKYTYGKNISEICLENPQKLQINYHEDY